MNQHKVAIVTGASTGIGRAVALRYAAERFNVTLVALPGEDLDAVQKELEAIAGIEIIVCPGDLSDMVFTQSVIDITTEKWNRIDVLVNNAAWRTIETMRTMNIETWKQTLSICLTAPAFLAKWTAELMEKLAIGGTIINVSSVMAGRAGGNSPAYIAAKGAIESLTYELAVTYGRSSIRVVCVQPGNVDTKMSKDYVDQAGDNISADLVEHLNDLTPLARAGSPVEIAEAIYWLSTDNASFITGTTLMIDGGLSHNFNGYTIKKHQFPDQY